MLLAPARRAAVILALLPLVLLAAPARAEAAGEALLARQEGIWRYVSAAGVARALGAPLEIRDGVLTLRSRLGVLTAFEASPYALWQAAGRHEAAEIAAASPILVLEGAWYLPEDLLGVLGVQVEGERVTLPDGRVRPLHVITPPSPIGAGRSELIELAPGLEALRLYAASPAGPDTVSLLAVDLGLLALAFPEQREALDLQLRDLHADKVLLLVITSVSRAAWDPAIYVVQDGVEVLLRAPLAVQVLEGDPEEVRRDAPVVAVAFLPTSFDLRRPLQLRWAGASGSVTLRR